MRMAVTLQLKRNVRRRRMTVLSKKLANVAIHGIP